MFSNCKKLKSLFKRPSGFTLTEVLVIVLVIAVLTAIAYPLYTKAISKSRAVEAVNLLQIVRTKQIEHYARTRGYYTDFNNMGQLTNNKGAEIADGPSITIKDYKVTMDTPNECLVAEYDKGGVKFAISASYSREGLGCSGDICGSFGSVVGLADEVCALPGGNGGGGTGGGSGGGTGGCTTGSKSYGGCAGGQYQSCTSAGQWDGNCQCPQGQTLQGGECTTISSQICTPGQTQACGTCGMQACKSDGTGWESCVETAKPEETRECGCNNGGEQSPTCNTSSATWEWGECSIKECDFVCDNAKKVYDKDLKECVCDSNILCVYKAGFKGINAETCECEYDTYCKEPHIADESGSCVCPALKKCEKGEKWDEGTCECVGDKEENCVPPDVWLCGSGVSTDIGKITGTGKITEEGQCCVPCEEAGGTPICSAIAGKESCTCRIGGGSGGICEAGATQACGNCGTKTCNSGGTAWGSCQNEGVCTPGETGTDIPVDPTCTGKFCLIMLEATCNDQCQWESVGGGGCQPGEQRACSGGRQICLIDGTWGSCQEAEANPITVVLCNVWAPWNGQCCRSISWPYGEEEGCGGIGGGYVSNACYDFWRPTDEFPQYCAPGSTYFERNQVGCYDKDRPGLMTDCCGPASSFINPGLAETACNFNRQIELLN